jgi:hypothetical protein
MLCFEGAGVMAVSQADIIESAVVKADDYSAKGLPVPEDKRLERLFDYTKFHMSIYLSATGGLVAIVGVAADQRAFLGRLIGWPLGLVLALIAMLIAGIAGGVVASSATLCTTFEDLWDKPQGPFSWRWFPGRVWAAVEHFSFWLSIVFVAAAVLSAPAVSTWLTSPH